MTNICVYKIKRVFGTFFLLVNAHLHFLSLAKMANMTNSSQLIVGLNSVCLLQLSADNCNDIKAISLHTILNHAPEWGSVHVYVPIECIHGSNAQEYLGSNGCYVAPKVNCQSTGGQKAKSKNHMKSCLAHVHYLNTVDRMRMNGPSMGILVHPLLLLLL